MTERHTSTKDNGRFPLLRLQYPQVTLPASVFSGLSLFGAFAHGMYFLWFFGALWAVIWAVMGTIVLVIAHLRSVTARVELLNTTFSWRFFFVLLPLFALIAGTCAVNLATLPDICRSINPESAC